MNAGDFLDLMQNRSDLKKVKNFKKNDEIYVFLIEVYKIIYTCFKLLIIDFIQNVNIMLIQHLCDTKICGVKFHIDSLFISADHKVPNSFSLIPNSYLASFHKCHFTNLLIINEETRF